MTNSDQANVTLVSLALGHYIAGEIPDEVLDSARAELKDSLFRGAWVQAFGGDLHIHLTTFNGDFLEGGRDPVKTSLKGALKAGLAALATAVDSKLAQADAAELLSQSADRQSEALGLRFLTLPYTERGAEPIFVAKAINGGCGFFNRAMFNLFFNPDKGSGRRIEGNDYLGIVESIEDLTAGKENIRTYEFGPGDLNELVALIADAEEWRLSRVYAVKGKFGTGDLKGEPAAIVEGSSDPFLIGRSQSGLPAVGEFTQIAGEFYFGPGGKNGAYRVGLMPVNFEQARARLTEPGTARVVAYAYQSYDKGRMPAESDIVDIFSQNRPETLYFQREAGKVIRHMVSHGEFEPYLNPKTAEARAQEEANRLASRLQDIPNPDPIIEAANANASFTLSDIKADGGGKVGHTTPPNHFRGVAEASLQEARNSGLISATSEIIEVGDDEHLLMTHSRGADDNAVHLFAYRTFFRQVWVAKTLEYQWYGLGQDLIGDASAGRAIEEIANLTDEFISLLPNFLPKAEKDQMHRLRGAYGDWKQGLVEGHEPTPVFSGNVSGQGPGFAEIPMNRPQRFGLLAIDKSGPSAFNLPVWWSLNQAYRSGSLRAHLQSVGAGGAVLEVWDVEHHRRIFLDLESDWPSAETLLGAVEKFNVKRIWSRSAAGWDPDRPGDSLGEVLLSASTEKLAVISGGEYLGKDDPVLLAAEPLAEALNLFMRDRFYMTQGDGRGSHYMCPAPLSFRDAIATISSRGVAVSAWITLDGTGRITEFRDVFDDPIYEAARDRTFTFNKAIWEAQGGNFIPVGVGAAKVEQSYPLAKTLDRITAEDSNYKSDRYTRVKAEDLVAETS